LVFVFTGVLAGALPAWRTRDPAFLAAAATLVAPSSMAVLATAVIRRTVVFVEAGLRFDAAGLPPIARSTLPAASLTPAAAERALRFTARFAWAIDASASASTAFALRVTARFALPSACFASACAVVASRFAFDSTTRAFLAIVAPTSCAFAPAASTASPILVSSPLPVVLVAIVVAPRNR
ncbi:MAG: hypothetical protein KAX82_06020, partial [Burkholderiales bacterium]|nr:hypothetical protein [Burkholderiales bacterium]